MGELGLDIEYFYSLTPREFYNLQKGVNSRIKAEHDREFFYTRVLAYYVYMSIPFKKGAKKEKFESFLKVNEEDVEKEVSIDNIRAFFKRIDNQN